MGNECIKKKTRKDLRVTTVDSLSPEKHINKITAKTYDLLRNIKAAFNYTDRNDQETDYNPNKAKIGVCSPSMVSKLEKTLKKTRKNPESSLKTSFKFKGTII